MRVTPVTQLASIGGTGLILNVLVEGMTGLYCDPTRTPIKLCKVFKVPFRDRVSISPVAWARKTGNASIWRDSLDTGILLELSL